MKQAIFIDMDGTIANLYAVQGWRDMLDNHIAKPYAKAKPMVDMSRLAYYLHQAQRKGYTIGIISWLSKNSTATYSQEVTEIKIKWLRKHLPSVRFDEIHILPYGTPKSTVAHSATDILFDDELRNRLEWCGTAFYPSRIFEILRSLR